MKALRALMWGSIALIAWAHAGYPLSAAALARVRRYAPRRNEGFFPRVTLVIAAHNEEHTIRERLENALRLDYPRERLEILVASDGSTDGTGAIVETFAERGVRLLDRPRSGKVVAQNAAVAATTADVVAFSDANSLWEPDALRLLVRNLADPDVAYVCGCLRWEALASSDNREGLYWGLELWLREQESACGSITAGNGGIYAIRRSAFIELGPEHSHDLGLPYRLRRRGLRSVYEPGALAREQALATTQAEWSRKVRMLSRAWWELLHGGMLDPRNQPPLFFGALVSHRLLRYSSGVLHLIVLATSARLSSRNRDARALLALQVGAVTLAVLGWRRPWLPLAGVAWYYTVVTGASLVGLLRALADRPYVTWSPIRAKRS